jgi:predicted nucleic acid-binding Zn ribbon protein
VRDGTSWRDLGPRPVGASLETVAGGLGLPGSVGFGRLFARWGDIVGPTMAAHVEPVRLESDGLVVRVDHPAWATQVRHLSDSILDRVAEVAQVERPGRLEVRIRG